jgi:hypothetical protein
MTEEEHIPSDNAGSLTLSDYLLERMKSTARIGAIVMKLCIVLAASYGLTLLYEFSEWFSALESDYYLMEKNNLYKAVDALSSAVMLFLFVRGVKEGHQSFQLLRHSVNDDDALLEGNERLVAMLRWFALFGFLFVGVLLLQKIWFEFL